mgnify:CR=1 FL=1|tara:strand:- start:228 stop:386 length:159 start_codon:yes stop_codon:yes gene_type:complete
MKFTIKAESNGAILFKDVDPSNEKYINILKEKGWVEVKEEKLKSKPKAKKKK